MQSNILARNPALISGIAGLTQSFIALDNIGALNVQTFEAMQRTGLVMCNRIQGEVEALGGTTRDALLPMQGFLHEAAKQAELLGVPLDANVQFLIDSSKEAGIWRDTQVPAQDRIAGSMERLVALMERFIGTLTRRRRRCQRPGHRRRERREALRQCHLQRRDSSGAGAR